MIVASALIFISFAFILKILWTNRKFISFAYKIPFSDHKYDPKSLYNVFTADTKMLFDMAHGSCKNLESISKTIHGTMLLFIIQKPEEIKVILNSKNALDKSSIMKFALLDQGSLFGTLEAWQRHHKIMEPYFGVVSLKSLIPIFNKKSLILTRILGKHVGKKEFDIFHDLTALTLETILNAMDLDIDFQNMEQGERDIPIKSLELGTEIFTQRIFKFWLHYDIFYKRSVYYKILEQHLGQSAFKYADVIMNKIRKEQENEKEDPDEKPKSFVKALMSKKYNLTDEEIGDEIKTMLVAAQDTTAVSISSTLLLLAMNKDVQNKLFEELRDFIPSKDAQIDIETLNKLSYLDQVVNESLRILPIIPFVTRRTDAEIILEDCTLPKGIEVIIPVLRVHTNPSWWGDDAHLFKPERFERENIKKVHPYAYIPFTKGPRMCLGWKYAIFLTKINLIHLLMHYEFDTRLTMEELEFKFNITLNVCQGYRMKIIERKY